MNECYIKYKQRILNYNAKKLFVSTTLLTLAMFTISLTYMSESVQNSSATTQDPQQIVQQGIVTSTPDPLPGHEAHQSITILKLKEGNPTYKGVVSFIASKPVEVQILHRNMTQSNGNLADAVPTIPKEFGTMSVLPLPGGNGQVVSSLILPTYPEEATSFSASVPFVGNGLALHNVDGDDFVATYTVVADQLSQAQRADDIAISTEQNEDEDEDNNEDDEEN